MGSYSLAVSVGGEADGAFVGCSLNVRHVLGYQLGHVAKPGEDSSLSEPSTCR